jgi:glycine oxidase
LLAQDSSAVPSRGFWRKEVLRVILTDAAKFGNEASAAGAGMLAPGGEYREFSPAAELALQSLAMYPTFIRALEKESGVRIDFRKCGAVELAYECERWEHLEKRANVQRRFGISVDSICTSTLRELAPGLNLGGLRGALYYPNDSSVAPQDLLKALKIACERSGVTILEQTPVKSIQAEQDGIAAVTESGVIKTRSGVLAAGAWSSQIPVCHSETLVSIPSTFPVKGHIIGYQLPPGSLQRLITNN